MSELRSALVDGSFNPSSGDAAESSTVDPTPDEIVRDVPTDPLVSIAASTESGSAPPETVAAEAQILLAVLGYDPGAAGDQASLQIKTAIELFQRDRGVDVTGRIDRSLIEDLRSALVDGSFSPSGAKSPIDEGRQN